MRRAIPLAFLGLASAVLQVHAQPVVNPGGVVNAGSVPSVYYQAQTKRDDQGTKSAMPPSRRATLPAPVVVRFEPLRADEVEAAMSKPGPQPVGLSRRLAGATTKGIVKSERSGMRVPGAWAGLADGTAVWRLKIQSPGAAALRVRFARFSVGDGRVWVHDARPTGVQAVGPYTGRGLHGDGEFWSGAVFSDEVIVEYQPSNAARPSEAVPFLVPEISHIWSPPGTLPDPDVMPPAQALAEQLRPVVRNVFGPSSVSAGLRQARAAPCHLDVTCYPEWTNNATMVALILYQEEGVAYVCSGTLMNDRVEDTYVPYFLTAGHCVNNETVARSVQTFWFYQTASCNAQPPHIRDVPNIEGATYLTGRHDWLQGDFSLLRLPDLPNNAWLSGWSPELLWFYPQDVTTIHHPRGEFKRVVFGQLVAEYPFSIGDHRIYATVRQTDGRTEGGSSGAGLFDREHLLGVLSFGYMPAPGSNITACDIEPFYDAYTRFSEIYPVVRPFLGVQPQSGPDLTILKADTSDHYFNRGSNGEYVIRVTNSGAGPTAGTVTVRDDLPGGLTPIQAVGAGWTCDIVNQTVTCDRYDALSPGQSYPDIALKVNVASDAPSSFKNEATVSGGGETNTGNSSYVRYTQAASDHALTSGVPWPFSLPASSPRVLIDRYFDEQYTISVPSSATKLEVVLAKEGVGVDVLMYVRAGRRVRLVYGDEVLADASVRVGDSGEGRITITRDSPRPLKAGVYYIALERPASPSITKGVITASVTVPASLEAQLTEVLNAASLQAGPIAPGELITLIGDGLGPVDGTYALQSGEAFPTSLADVTVLFNGVPAPLFFVCHDQINAQVPYWVSSRDRVKVEVSYGDQRSNALTLSVADSAPGLFTLADGSGRVAAVHGAEAAGPGGLIVPENPAQPGETVIFWATGEGLTSPPSVEGTPPAPPYPRPVLPVSLKIGGKDAEILYAGCAPGLPGVFQVKARVPVDSAVAGNVAVVLTIGSARSQPDVYLAVAGGRPTSPSVTLSASPTRINAGESATLSWSSSNATSAWIDPGIGAVPVNGSRTVSPAITTTYTITVRGEQGEASAWARVEVMAPAEMLEPPPGSTLPGSTVTFRWSAGSGVSSYHLRVGNAADGRDIYDVDQGQRLSATVTGIPVDGRRIYVRLFSRIGDDWHYKDYTYTAWTAPRASVTPGLWRGMDIAYFVSQDGSKLTPTGSPLVSSSRSMSLQVTLRNACASGTVIYSTRGEIPIASGSFEKVFRFSYPVPEELVVSGRFESSVRATGTWVLTQETCRASQNWQAAPATQ